jgi:CxxC motif-containing protein (DUF1111 family)
VAAAGSTLPGLDPTLISLFAAGRAEFEKAETVDSGLGPIFNDNSCGACHRGPALGGASGRAATVEDAIRAHEGQGKGAKDRYAALSPAQRKALLDFLGTL